METFDIYKDIKKVHFVGIGGISMSALAKLFFAQNIAVSGSDKCAGKMVSQLKDLGITIYNKHSKTNITEDTDLVVYSLAIKEDNPELKIAKKLNIPCIKRGEALGLIAKKYNNIIAISGMHGKTTTTAMVYNIFKFCGKNPTLHIGGEIDEKNKNLIIGDSEFFITEACEYGDSFLSIKNAVSVINNIEKEHLDYFKNLKNIYRSFEKFCNQSKACFVNSSLKNKIATLPDYYVGKGGNIYGTNLKKSGAGYSFDVYIKEDFYGKIKLKVPGKYNIQNSLSAIAIANYFGLEKDRVILALNSFQNVKMRFERAGYFAGNGIIFDYAHHPTEIKNVIEASKKLGEGKVYVYFQPHTFSRTKSLKNEFAKCFKGADSVFVLKTYKAREVVDKENDEQSLAKIISDNMGIKVGYGGMSKMLGDIKSRKNSGIMLFVGAGDMQNKVKKALFEAK